MKSVIITLIYLISVFLTGQQLLGQDHHERWSSLDVQHYRFELDLNDTTDIIRGIAEIEIHFKKDLQECRLDLAGVEKKGLGMNITQVLEDGNPVEFHHANHQIVLYPRGRLKGSSRIYRISYHGIPADGLIISRNKFKDRTFFGDNWPDRARHWLPVVDHPSDKATLEFIVEAPSHYKVVANGSKIHEKEEHNRITSHWKTDVPLPSKLMVIGVSPFSVQNLNSASGVPVSTWVYPQNECEGFYDYSIATRPLDFFETYIAPYPYSKLANVQSKTRYGGMENASCIFYHQRTVTGKRNYETLFAHEIAHQWFGDAVSELDWHHIWLSEGFATYLTDIYLEQMHGRNTFVASMLDEKRQVLEFAKKRLAPIVDTTLPVSVKLLNNNSYEKAGWVLHMLRHELGDELFHQSVQSFYHKFKFRNALTSDFRKVVDSVSNSDYGPFFDQWFFTPGHPVLSSSMTFEGGEVTLTISQHQKTDPFFFSLDITLVLKDGTEIRKTFDILSRYHTFQIPASSPPENMTLDPDTWLLFEHHHSP